jgi:hypothetical protein
MSKFQKRVTVKKSLSGARKFRKWDDYAIGDVLIGKYLGRTQPDQYGKINTIVEVLDAQFKDGTGEDYNGKSLVLNSNGILDKNIEEVSEGEYIQIEYGGKATIEKGKYKGKEAHSMKIEVVEIGDEEDNGEDL